MPKPFDATLNHLIDARPDDWAAFLAERAGVPPGPAAVLDTDLSLTVQADKVFRVEGVAPALLHLELESNPRLGMPGDLLRYNVLVGHQSGLPVHTVLMLLRPKANATDQTGVHRLRGANGAVYLEFRYAVVRVWEESMGGLLAAGVGLAPLAILTNEAAADVPAAFIRLTDRLRGANLAGNVVEELIGSAFVLGGLRYDPNQLAKVYQTMAVNLEESTTYQWILDKGDARGVQRTVLNQARKRFGEPDAAADARLRAITDAERLDRMAERIFDAAGWDDLLSTP